jgi:hypothetical protein
MDKISEERKIFRYEKKRFVGVPIFLIGLSALFYSLWYFNFTIMNASWDFRKFIGVLLFIYTSYIFLSLFLITGWSIVKTKRPSLKIYKDHLVDHLGNIFKYSEFKNIIMNDPPTANEIIFPFLRKGPVMGYEMVRNDNKHFHITNHAIRSIDHHDLHRLISGAMHDYRKQLR